MNLELVSSDCKELTYRYAKAQFQKQSLSQRNGIKIETHLRMDPPKVT